MVRVAAWSRQEGTGGGFFWTISLKQVERWEGAGSEAWPFFLNVRLSFSAALQGKKELASVAWKISQKYSLKRPLFIKCMKGRL